MEKSIIKVNGMSCNHCKMAIEKALKAIDVEAEVDLENKSVRVTYDSQKVDIAKIEDVIDDQGYEVVK